SAFNSRKTKPITLSTNASATDPTATVVTTCFSERRPTVPLCSAPKIGSRTMGRRMCWMSNDIRIPVRRAVRQEVRSIALDGLPEAEEADEDREADRRFGGGHRDHEEREHLALMVPGLGGAGAPPVERDQGQVDRVQHDLDRHELEEGVAPG